MTDLFDIREGSIRDYDRLARFHYRAARPATFVRILCAHDSRELVGILVISMPTLNGRWRDLAWPGRFRTADRRADTARINAELRTISRVIIDPRYRGRGLGAALVRHYLRTPLTPATEAIGAMGACCPFFESAGMRRIELPPCERDTRLREHLRALRMTPIQILAAPTPPRDALTALRTWANASRATRPLLSEPPRELARAAAFAILARPIAYAHGFEPHPRTQAPLAARRGPEGTRCLTPHRSPATESSPTRPRSTSAARRSTARSCANG